MCVCLTAGSVTSTGALKVNDHMQVQGFTNIYAVGDCADVNEPKMAYHAALHADVAVNNIANSVSGKELKSYRTGETPGRLSCCPSVTDQLHHQAPSPCCWRSATTTAWVSWAATSCRAAWWPWGRVAPCCCGRAGGRWTRSSPDTHTHTPEHHGASS